MRVGILNGMSTTQIAVRLPDELLAAVDLLVSRGDAGNRTDAVRRGLQFLVAEMERREIDRAIVDGYTRNPQTSGETGWAEESLKAAIEQEPW